MPFTEAGFKRRTYQEWLEHDVALAKELFGENINTSEDTPLGKYIRLNCEDKRDIEEELEDIEPEELQEMVEMEPDEVKN